MTPVTTAKLRDKARCQLCDWDGVQHLGDCRPYPTPDTPADTEENDMGTMTITQEQFEAIWQKGGCPKNEFREFLIEQGFTITPPEPPEAMVKLAREASMPAEFLGNATIWEAGYVAALQYAVKTVKDAPGQVVDGQSYVSRTAALAALGWVQHDAR